MWRIHSIEEPGKELRDYTPHAYADEGPPPTDPALEAVSISGDVFDPDALLDLGPKFGGLAAACRPEPRSLSHSATL
ncbi:hypothetical protein Z043_113322 [Scleropages formosus]|uniref:Uncharacterized protein n=1 Tax=Scleropages formosus TaxID=113540 RepID=A0A0P7U1P1_SCLFO|nr:hypothetical protein Z043_113322 [Scleropages formosus]